MTSPEDSSVSGKHQVEQTLVNSAVMVALVSAFSYIAAYQYEKGFCGYFGIPNSLIVVDLTTVVAWAASLLFITLIFLGVANALPSKVRSILWELRWSYSLFVLVCLLLLRPSGVALYFFLGLLALFSFLEFVVPLITQKAVKGYLAKLKAQEDVAYQGSEVYERVARVLVRNAGPRGAMALWWMGFAALFLAHFAGMARARTQNEFIVIPESPELVVLRVYNETLVCAPLHRAEKEIEPPFTILRIGSIGEGRRQTLQSAMVGPLRLRENRVAPERRSYDEAPDGLDEGF